MKLWKITTRKVTFPVTQSQHESTPGKSAATELILSGSMLPEFDAKARDSLFEPARAAALAVAWVTPSVRSTQSARIVMRLYLVEGVALHEIENHPDWLSLGYNAKRRSPVEILSTLAATHIDEVSILDVVGFARKVGIRDTRKLAKRLIDAGLGVIPEKKAHVLRGYLFDGKGRAEIGKEGFEGEPLSLSSVGSEIKRGRDLIRGLITEGTITGRKAVEDEPSPPIKTLDTKRAVALVLAWVRPSGRSTMPQKTVLRLHITQSLHPDEIATSVDWRSFSAGITKTHPETLLEELVNKELDSVPSLALEDFVEKNNIGDSQALALRLIEEAIDRIASTGKNPKISERKAFILRKLLFKGKTEAAITEEGYSGEVLTAGSVATAVNSGKKEIVRLILDGEILEN